MSVRAGTYYVDSTGGNDSNSGTATNAAWQSVAKVNATAFASGDFILFKAGGSWSGPLNPKGSGTAGSPIVIDRYGAGSKPLIDGNGVNGTGTTGGGAVFLYNQEYWEINNLEIVNDAESDGERRGVHIAAANFGTVNHIHIKNCQIHDIRGRLSVTDGDLIAKRTGGIIVEVISDTSVPTRFNDVLIEGNTITTVRNQGIIAAGNRSGQSDFPLSSAWNARRASNLIIRSNTISDVTKNALILRLADNTCLVEWNVCFDTATLDTGNTMFTAACDGVVFQFNEGYENHAGPLGDHDGSLYDADLRSTSITFQYSYSHDNAHGLFWQYPSASGPNSNIVVRYNISRNDRGIIFAFSGDAGADSATHIYNNTIYTAPHLSPILFDGRTSAANTYFVSNNIFYNLSATASFSFDGSDTAAFDRNVWYGQHVAGEPAEANKLTNDPLLLAPGTGTNGIGTLAGYKLQVGSAAIDSGQTIANNGGLDFFGNIVPQNGVTDRGAHEFVSTPTMNPPNISQQPQSLTVTNGNSAKISVTASGAAPLAYQWRKDGTPIGGATVTNLFFAAVSTNDAANYHVVITNVAGAITSSFATLTVYVPPSGIAPTITTNPQSQTVSVGANVTFTAAANGTAPLSYRWRKAGNAIANATNTSLALTSVTTNDAASYDFVVTNSFGAVPSSVATLTVTVSPPSGSGGVVLAECYNGGGKTGATFNRDYIVLKNISGSTVNLVNWSLQHLKAGVWQTPFVLTNVTLPAGGFFLVQAYFDGGTAIGATSTADAVTPQTSAWNFSTSSAGAVALVNNANILSGCGSTNIVDLFGWFATAGNCYEGLGVPGAGSATQSNQRLASGCQDSDSNTNDFTLALPTGRNSLTAPASCGCGAPTIAPQPTNITVSAGFTASFSVTASGTTPAYQWRKNGAPIVGATTSVLNFNPAATNDAGSFDVVVTNSCGAITSSIVTLTVTTDPPVILNDPQSQAVALGSPVTLLITVAGSLPLNFQWRKAGSPLAGATNLSLNISNVTTNELGNYDVVVTNDFGVTLSDGATISLAPTNQPPSITSQPAGQIVVAGANVSFSVAASGAAPLSYRWRKGGVTIANATNLIYNLSSVTTNSAGGFDVVVTNAFGVVTSTVATLTVTPVGTNSSNVNPADYINPRFANVTVTSGVKFADVINYKGVPTSLFLDVYQPTGDTNTSRPAIVWIHGGGFRTGSSRTQSYIVTYATEFAKRGYVCFSIDHRLRSGSDMPTQESELPAEQDGAADCNTAFNWLRTNSAAYLINTNWLFVGGGSAGGRIGNVFSFHEGPDTNVCLTCTSAILTNSVNVVPPVDWNRSGLIANASLWGAPEPVMRWYVLQSNDTPTVIIHGTADATIDYQNALDLYADLRNVGATVVLDPLVGYGHTPTSANSLIIPWIANFFAQEWTKTLTSLVSPPQLLPIHLRGVLISSNEIFQLSFTNVAAESFTVLCTTNLMLPVNDWTPLGPVPEIAPGQYQFTDAGSMSNAVRYYGVRSP